MVAMGEPAAVDATARFSDRVEDYIRYRPGYPRELLDVLRRDCGLLEESAIADIGCGPGNLAIMFLENGNKVFGVEPNDAMRTAGEQALRRFPRFQAFNGRAEDTGLPSSSVEFVTAGQAFHWFEPAATRAEFCRILKPGGWVALVWNERREGASAFSDAYEQILLRYGTNYSAIRQSRGDEISIRSFFGDSSVNTATFTHAHVFDFDGLRGRLLSSSYAPQSGQAGHDDMLADLRAIFDRYQQAGAVPFEYETSMFYGRLNR
jgi:SAM-dependent methyltransferase